MKTENVLPGRKEKKIRKSTKKMKIKTDELGKKKM